MPYLPTSKTCSELNCKNNRSKLNSFCTKHGGLNFTVNKLNSEYHTRAWKSIRQRQLSIQPLCQACLLDNKVETAQHIDHVFPWKQIGPHAFLHNIYQSLCLEHHSHKTQLEQQGKYIHYTKEKALELTQADYGAQMHQFFLET